MSDTLTPTLERHVESGAVPGAVVLVARGERARVVTAGRMSLDGPAMREDAVMRIQSMTKPVVTVATLLAVQSGDLALDDPVSRWMPELSDRRVLRSPDAPISDVVPAERDITVRDLLTNGSGYGIQTGECPLAGAYRDAGVEAGTEPPTLGADAWLASLATLPLAHQPGQGFRYHHGFGLLGILLQRFAGVPLEDHLRTVVFDPLGMPDTSLSVPTGQAHRLPAAYRHGDSGLEETEPLHGGFYLGEPPFDTAHGELVSTAADYHRLCRMIADGGRHAGRTFLDAGLVREMTRDQVPDSVKTPESFFPGFWADMGWGYGGSVVTGGDHAGRYAWSGGQGTDFFVDPDGTISVFLTQVELGDVMWPVVGEVQGAAASLLDP